MEGVDARLTLLQTAAITDASPLLGCDYEHVPVPDTPYEVLVTHVEPSLDTTQTRFFGQITGGERNEDEDPVRPVPEEQVNCMGGDEI